MYTVGYNNQGQAKKNPVNSREMVYAIIANACKRFLEGQIQEHKSYTFYNGSQLVVWISEAQYQRLNNMLIAEGEAMKDGVGELVVNGKLLGEWRLGYFHKKLSCRLILNLSPDFIKVHSIIKRFAQLAPEPISKNAKFHTCECGFPMLKPIDGEYLCDDCFNKKHPGNLF